MLAPATGLRGEGVGAMFSLPAGGLVHLVAIYLIRAIDTDEWGSPARDCSPA